MPEENTCTLEFKIKTIADYVLYHKDEQTIPMYCKINNINPAFVIGIINTKIQMNS